MKLENKTILVTGSNRGIGKALVTALLKHPVTRIYAAARKTEDIPAFGDSRVVPLKLDITDLDLVQQAVALAQDVDVLINNAGVAAFSSVVTGDPDALKHDLEVNYLGTLNVVRAFAPVLEKKGGGAIANVISVLGLSSMSAVGGYSASKAALFSATQAMRAELKAKGISVHGIFPGPIDTDMSRDFDMPKASTQETAENIIKGILADQEDIFPDPMSAQVGELWAKDPKGLERQFSGV
ncbi:SDR family oxidoreductase [Oryzomonas rubra]|uniref:SDR family NAD(P)-dependent oxidoreductase n=1 Tax=Oryzomonas rubra TaxID=2509454 RepID=A0A5A9XBT8_9BACT|nr:SDR family oxidoreductase [Oryzomonas rubra]KAA0889131.1 SDR family NAD(P)-dependent oxidoreductase [Oryzomonas rubra]